jgi:thiol-disulfide isomerase/thioredoxin
MQAFTFKTFAAAALLAASSLVQALTLAPYTPQALAQAQAEGAAVALHFHADWCPTCRAQDKVLQSLMAEPDLKVLVLAVDYDNEADLKRALKVRNQSTFVVYHGKAEVARQTGETSAAGIRTLLGKAL